MKWGEGEGGGGGGRGVAEAPPLQVGRRLLPRLLHHPAVLRMKINADMLLHVYVSFNDKVIEPQLAVINEPCLVLLKFF